MNDKYISLKMLCPKYQIKLMILFGSYNTDDFNSESDIDPAIEVDDCDLIYKYREQLLNEISSIFSFRDIDLVLLNHADPLLKKQIVSSGELIYERRPGDFNKFKVRAYKEYFDAKKFYQSDKDLIKKYIKGGGNNGRQRVSPPQIN